MSFQAATGGFTSTDPDLRHYLRIFWRRKWTIAIVTACVFAVALTLVERQTRTYTARTELVLQSSNSLSALAGGASVSSPDVATQLVVVAGAPVRSAVMKEVGPDAPVASASQVGQTGAFTISVSSSNPGLAARTANAYASAYIANGQEHTTRSYLAVEGVVRNRLSQATEQLNALDSGGQATSAHATALVTEISQYQVQLDQLGLNASLATAAALVVSPASTPATPSSPHPKTTAGIALLVGLILGCGLALVRDYLDDSVKSQVDLTDAVPGTPVLGAVPFVAQRRKKELALAPNAPPGSGSTEPYRQLRTAIQFTQLGRGWKTIQITSSGAAEGKTTTAVNLALVSHQAGLRVLLVDADLRHPRIHRLFDVGHEEGLTSVLTGDSSLESAIVDTTPLGLSFLPCGPIPPNPAELMSSPKMAELLTRLRENFDLVLIDSPPVLPVTDAVALSAQVDGTIFVVRSDTTSRRALRRSFEMLDQVNTHPIGVVLNAVPVHGFFRSGYDYGYYGRYYGHYRDTAGVGTDVIVSGSGNGSGKLVRHDIRSNQPSGS